MIRFIIKRLFMFIPVLLGVILLIFLILDFAPGDPAVMILGDEARPEQLAELREEMGLNDPLLFRYGHYVLNLVQGSMGISYKSQLSVAHEIGARFPNTLRLAVAGVLVAVILALPLGIIAAIKQNSIFDSASMLFSLIGISMPGFWLALLLMLFFSLRLGWFPVSGADTLSHLVLPAVALGLGHMAAIARTTRSSMLEVIRQDYIRTALSKGLPYRTVVLRHALPNAIIPTITIIGLQIGLLLGGTVVIETVFSWPGVGRLLIQSIYARDTPLVLGCIVVICLCYSVVNLIVDLLYAAVDPRLRARFK